MVRGNVHCVVVKRVVYELGAIVGGGPEGRGVRQAEEVAQCEGERK